MPSVEPSVIQPIISQPISSQPQPEVVNTASTTLQTIPEVNQVASINTNQQIEASQQAPQVILPKVDVKPAVIPTPMPAQDTISPIPEVMPGNDDDNIPTIL